MPYKPRSILRLAVICAMSAWAQGKSNAWADDLVAASYQGSYTVDQGLLSHAKSVGSRFRLFWDGKRYVCKNAAGQKGYNEVSLEELKATKQGECGDFYVKGPFGIGRFGVDLSGVDLSGANLRGARLCSADLFGAHLEGADLTGAKLVTASLVDAHLEDADLTQADLRGSQLNGTFFDGARLYGGTDFIGSNLRNARIKGALYDQYVIFPTNLDSIAAEILGMIFHKMPRR